MDPKRKLSVYPDPRALAVLGQSAPALNQALECWACLLEQAAAENSKAFSRPEWNTLADLLNGTLHEPRVTNPGEHLAVAVEDGQRLDRLADKWAADAQALADKLRQLDYAHAWAVITTVQWFWQNHKEINHDKDSWWKLAFRRRLSELCT